MIQIFRCFTAPGADQLAVSPFALLPCTRPLAARDDDLVLAACVEVALGHVPLLLPGDVPGVCATRQALSVLVAAGVFPHQRPHVQQELLLDGRRAHARGVGVTAFWKQTAAATRSIPRPG